MDLAQCLSRLAEMPTYDYVATYDERDQYEEDLLTIMRRAAFLLRSETIHYAGSWPPAASTAFAGWRKGQAATARVLVAMIDAGITPGDGNQLLLDVLAYDETEMCPEVLLLLNRVADAGFMCDATELVTEWANAGLWPVVLTDLPDSGSRFEALVRALAWMTERGASTEPDPQFSFLENLAEVHACAQKRAKQLLTWRARKRFLLAGSQAYPCQCSAPFRLRHIRHVHGDKERAVTMVCAAAVRFKKYHTGIGGRILAMLGKEP